MGVSGKSITRDKAAYFVGNARRGGLIPAYVWHHA